MLKAMKSKFSLLILAFTLLVSAGIVGLTNHADAGPEVIGNPNGANVRVLYAPAGGKVSRIQYFAGGSKTMAGANTPVASDPVCGLGSFTLYQAQVQLTGTMTGTAPTLAIKWQNSIDGGTTWSDVGTWTTINATVTPATQNQTVSDVYSASTAVAYGDCWRSTYTFGGSGTVTANFSVKGLAK